MWRLAYLENASSEAYSKMTAEICRIYEKELSIPGRAYLCHLSWCQRLGMGWKKFLIFFGKEIVRILG